jgi:hypothetical protein
MPDETALFSIENKKGLWTKFPDALTSQEI